MTNCKLVDTPIVQGTKLTKEDVAPQVDPTFYKILVGSFLYLSATRHDIMFAASFVSKFMQSLNISHWKVAKRILRYIAWIIDYGLFYTRSKKISLSGYTDSNCVGRLDDHKSTSRYAFSSWNQSDFMAIQETINRFNIFYRGKICSSKFSNVSMTVVDNIIERSIKCLKGTKSNLL